MENFTGIAPTQASIQRQIVEQGAELKRILRLCALPVVIAAIFVIYAHYRRDSVCHVYEHFRNYIDLWPYNLRYIGELESTSLSACEKGSFLCLSFLYGFVWSILIVFQVRRELRLSNDHYVGPLLSYLFVGTLFLLATPLFGFLKDRTLFGFSSKDGVDFLSIKLIAYQFGGYFGVLYTVNVWFLWFRSRRKRRASVG